MLLLFVRSERCLYRCPMSRGLYPLAMKHAPRTHPPRCAQVRSLVCSYAKAKKKEEGKKKAKKEGASRKRKGFIPAFSPINRFFVLNALVDIAFEVDLGQSRSCRVKHLLLMLFHTPSMMGSPVECVKAMKPSIGAFIGLCSLFTLGLDP